MLKLKTRKSVWTTKEQQTFHTDCLTAYSLLSVEIILCKNRHIQSVCAQVQLRYHNMSSVTRLQVLAPVQIETLTLLFHM